MKTTKNIIWFFINLLPFLPLILFAVQGLFTSGSSALSSLSFGALDLSVNVDSAVLSWDPDSLGGCILSTFWDPDLTVSAGSAGYAIMYGINMLSDAFGFTQVPFAFIVAAFLIVYWVLLYLLRILIDLLLLPVTLVERSIPYV